MKDFLSWENNRNKINQKLYTDILVEAFSHLETDGKAPACIIGHHLTFDGATTEPNEIPSADTLIFDHNVARRIWGDSWRDCLVRLVLEPVETRDKLLCKLYYERA